MKKMKTKIKLKKKKKIGKEKKKIARVGGSQRLLVLC